MVNEPHACPPSLEAGFKKRWGYDGSFAKNRAIARLSRR